MAIERIFQQLRGLGACEVLIKPLAPNDNSKNQIYLAGDVSALGKLPTGTVEWVQGSSTKLSEARRGPIFRAAVNLWWLGNEGNIQPAPHAKLIMYPQYSEVRLSGFLRNCEIAPSALFDINKRGREPGRVLLLAVMPDSRVVAKVFAANEEEAVELSALNFESYGVFRLLSLVHAQGNSDQILIAELRRIHRANWLDPVYLQADGTFSPCRGTNCGGVTLESHLGIRANGSAEPDFHGWEIKQHGVGNLLRPKASRITLMTPEPSGGDYVEQGPEYFVRTWGYPDRQGREDRLNFGGVYRCGEAAHNLTGLRLVLDGYDVCARTINGSGKVALLDSHDREAASWSFAKLMDHWRRKHSKAAFVPSEKSISPVRYRYGNNVMLAEGARFRVLLEAFAAGHVYYDPGIKLEGASGVNGALKRRSQFRVDSRNISMLYEYSRYVDVLD